MTHTRSTFLTASMLASAVALGACGKNTASGASADSTATAPVILNAQDIATVESRTIGTVIVVSGNLDPADIVTMRAQVPGTVTGVRVDRGSRVTAGQTLAVIEAQGIRSQAAGAQAQVAAAKAQLTVAQQRLEASKKLYEAGAISAIDYKSAQAAAEAADAQVAAAQAAAAAASESAQRATISAPIDGVVSARAVSGGEAVNVGAELFTIVNASELELDGQVGVQDAARVQVGQPVSFALDAFPNQVFKGRVARVDPTADPGTRQVGVYVRLNNAGGRIVGGQYARGRIDAGGGVTALVVPDAAITNRTADSAAVYTVAGNRVARKLVRLGTRDDAAGLVAVLSGLTAGEQVILNPASDIGDGTHVAIPSDPVTPAGEPATGASNGRSKP